MADIEDVRRPLEGVSMSEEQRDFTMDSPTAEDDSAPAVGDDGMGDLFGDDDDDVVSKKDGSRQSSATPSLPGSDADGLTAAEKKKRKALEYEEEEEGQEEQQVVVELNEAEASIPNLPLPASSDGKYWTLRMPSYLKLEPHPFDPDTYQGPGEDDLGGPPVTSRERSLGIKLEIESTIRWRWVKAPDGTMRKQSNTRIIRWSDGTMGLQVGKEMFNLSSDIDIPAKGTPRAAVQSSQQEAEPQSAHNINRNQGLTYVYAQHVRAELLQAEAAVSGTLNLTPTGMGSGFHQKLVKAVGARHNKVTRLMMAPAPTKESEMERAEQLKAAKKPKKRKAPSGESGTRRRSTAGRSSKRARDAEWSDEEPSDDDDDFSGRRLGKSPEVTRKRAGAGEYETDGFLVEDEEEEGGGRADSLEAAEEAIERLEATRKKGKTKKSKKSRDDDDDDDDDDDAEGDDAMAMSEDENEPGIRPAAGRKTKRLAAYEDSDEE